MRVLVLGGSGMLGHKICEVLEPKFETWATFRDSEGPWRTFPMFDNSPRTIEGVDAANFDSVAAAVDRVMPDVVLNCIGVIKQLKQSNDPILSITINALLPHRLARLCASRGVRLIHFSTDCVFSGRKGNYGEDEPTDAEDLYGRTKALGEVVREGCLTIRTSIIGRDFLKDAGLLEWFLSNRGGTVRGYRNAIFSGFPTLVLARIVCDLIRDHPDLSGLFHIASSPISKLELLTKIRDAMGVEVVIDAYDDPPCDRSLDGSRFVTATGYDIPAWEELIETLARDPTPYDSWRRKHGVRHP